MPSATINRGRRAAISALAVLGFSGIALSLADASAVQPTQTPPPAGAGEPGISAGKDSLATDERARELESSLESLEQGVAELSSYAAANSSRVHDPASMQQTGLTAAEVTRWIAQTRLAVELGPSGSQVDAWLQQADESSAQIDDLLAEAQARVAAWEKGEEITAAIQPIFEGGEGAVAVWDLQTNQPIVQWNADAPWTPGSTYKLFTAYSILNAIDQGQISGSNVAGWNLDACLYDMITISDNECAQDWLASWGFERVQQEASEIGAMDTYFTPGDLKTTANDLSLLMRRLYDGSILSEQSRSYLIDLLSTQIHRYGIPSVMPETDQVFNKVGFIFDYMNDTAVVLTPNGDYVITIMTKGLDWEQVRQSAATIRALLDVSG